MSDKLIVDLREAVLTVFERFTRKIRTDGPIPAHRPDLGACWIWTGSVMKNGYGQFRVRPKTMLAHRVSYELFVGPVPPGKQLDHLCRNRGCVRPDHLEPVTAKERIAVQP